MNFCLKLAFEGDRPFKREIFTFCGTLQLSAGWLYVGHPGERYAFLQCNLRKVLSFHGYPAKDFQIFVLIWLKYLWKWGNILRYNPPKVWLSADYTAESFLFFINISANSKQNSKIFQAFIRRWSIKNETKISCYSPFKCEYTYPVAHANSIAPTVHYCGSRNLISFSHFHFFSFQVM